MSDVVYKGKTINMDAVRNLMDDEICETLHGRVETDQEFVDAYAKAHFEKYGQEFVFN